MHKNLNGLLLGIVITGLSNAQEIHFEEVEIVGRRVNLVGEASSASEGLVSKAELDLRPLLRVGEVLETVPGLVATQHSGSGKANQYFLRGFNLDHGTDFATYIDGMPVNMRTHGHGQGYTDLNFIIPEMIDEIHYQKGPYYANVGDFSGTGAAFIRTIRSSSGSRIEAGAGKDGFQRALVTGDVGQRPGYFYCGVELQHYDGPWDDIEEDVDKKNVWLKQIWQQQKGSFALSLMAYDNQWNSADQIPQRAVDQGIITELGSLDTTVGGESSRYSIAANWLQTHSTTSLQINAYAIDYQMDLFSNFSYFTNPQGDQFQQVDDRLVYGGDIIFSADGMLGSKTMRNTIGSQLRFDAIDQVGLLATQAREEIGVFRVDTVDEWSGSVYWQNELDLTSQFRTTLGLRYDTFTFDVTPLRAADPASLALNGGEKSDDIVTTSVSISYQVNSNLELYGSVGDGFHSNDARGITISVDPSDSAIAVDPGDPLVPTFGYELGLRLFVSDKVNASVALWHLDVDSELLFVGDEGITEDTGESSNRDGLEVTLYYYASDLLTWDFEYAYTDAQFDRPLDGSSVIPGALETVISAGLYLNYGKNNYSNLRARYFGDYPLDGGERADESLLLNFRQHFQFNTHWSVALDILNLLDSRDHDIEYYYESQLIGETEPVADHHFHIFEPRTYRIYLAYAF